MIRLVLSDGLLFVGALAGLGAPWVSAFRRWPPLERLALAIGAALLTGWMVGFSLYAADLPLRWFWLAPALGALLALLRPGAARELGRDADVRSTLAQWALVAGWCLGWHAVVVNYSGAAWQGDWQEHYDRAHFFLARWPRDILFLQVYPLPSRPPLVNVWSAVLLSGGRGAFPHHQVFMTLLSSLVFLPLAAQVSAWGGDRRSRWLLLLVLMASPLFVQNATFPWTKLVAGFFIILAWQQLCPRDDPPMSGRLVSGAAALAAGMLAHYSAGPWIVGLALAWLVTASRDRAALSRPEWPLAVATAALVFLPWLAWSVWQYGLGPTFTQNTAVALAPQTDLPGRLHVAAGNLLHTLNPLPGAALDHPLLTQGSAAGRWRDAWFVLYQLRLWWALGVAGGLVLAWALRRAPPSPARRFGWIAVPCVVLLGTASHAHPDVLGLAHICLQPLVLLGLGWIAAQLPALPRWLRVVYAGGLAFDLINGIILHFALQSAWFGHADPAALWAQLPGAVRYNWQMKNLLGLEFIGDSHAPAWGVALAALCLALAFWRWRSAAR